MNNTKPPNYGIIVFWIIVFWPVGAYMLVKNLQNSKAAVINGSNAPRNVAFVLLGCAAITLAVGAYVTFSALNRVGDVFQTETAKVEGPLEPGKKSNFFSAGFFNKSPAGLTLDKVGIEYFEGDDVVIEERWMDRLIKKCKCE